MDLQHVIDVSFSLIMAVMGWFAREMYAAVQELKEDLSNLRENLPKEYVARNDYREDMREIKDLLNKIFDKLDNKVDK